MCLCQRPTVSGIGILVTYCPPQNPRFHQAMGYLDRYKLSVLLIFGLSTTLAATGNETRWMHICTEMVVRVYCPERHLFNITNVFIAYRADGCPSNLTDPVNSVADCDEAFGGSDNFIASKRFECNGSRSCELDLGGSVTLLCGSNTQNNFFSVSYTCYTDPNLPTRTRTQSPPNSTVPTSTEPSSPASVTEPFPYIIPIAASAGATLGLILIICIIICCIWRNRGDTSIERPDVRKESVTDVNIVKRGDDNRVKTAPRFKEDSNWNRPDLTPTTFDDNVQVDNPSYTRGLYSLPNKNAKPTAITIDTDDSLPPSQYEIISSENETSPGKPLIKHNYEKTKLTNEASTTYTNVTFKNDPDDADNSSIENHVHFADDNEGMDRGSPDGGQPTDEVDMREHPPMERERVRSALYTQVNK